MIVLCKLLESSVLMVSIATDFFFNFFLFSFLNIFWGHKSFSWDHWHPCFGLRVRSTLGFKARFDPSLACFLACAQWISLNNQNTRSFTRLVAVKTTGFRHSSLVGELLMGLNLPVGNDIGFGITTPVEINKALRYPLHKHTLTKTTILKTSAFYLTECRQKRLNFDCVDTKNSGGSRISQGGANP